MNAKPKGLGRGLGALIGDVTEATAPDMNVSVNDIDVNREQPRRHFDEDKLTELCESIKVHGVLQPLLLKKSGDRFTIIAGERRFRAARMAGLKSVPAVVREFDERQSLEVAIIENIQREDLNPIEEAKAIRQLIDEYALTQEEVAARLSYSRSAVANLLRLLALPVAVEEDIITGKLSAGHARALLALKDEKLIVEQCKIVIDEQLSVRQTEALVKSVLERKPKRAKKPAPEFTYAEREIGAALETKVAISGSNSRGAIKIEYYSSEQLEALIGVLSKTDE